MRLPQRLTIRLKILIVTAALLLIFALTNFLSIRLSQDVVNELDTITDYFVPLSTIASKIDVETFEFELNLRRLIQESPLEPSRLARIVARQIELTKRLEEECSAVAHLIDTAIKDVRNEVLERVELARIAGRFSLIRRNVQPFVQLGSTVLAAIRQERHADACCAALLQQAAIVAFRRELPQLLGLRRNVPDFKVRMGLATGEVVIGTIGSETARSYTVIGDIVNTASRLEGINKLYGTGIVVAEDTYRLAQQTVEVRELDFVTVVGKTEPVRIFELLGQAGEMAPEMCALRDLFAHGLAAYRERDWDSAEEKFQECLKLAPEDGPSRLFEQRVAFFRANPPAADWQGVWQATEK